MTGERTTAGALGRLKSFGLTEPWQVALLLPKRYEDFRCARTIAGAPEDGPVIVRGRIAKAPEVRFNRSGPTMMVSRIGDGSGYAGLTAFGDSRALQAELVLGRELVIAGRASRFNDELWIRDPEVVDPVWLGRLRPVYAGIPRVMRPETVRERVLGGLRQALPIAASWLVESLDLGRPGRRRLAAQWLSDAGIDGDGADMEARLRVALQRAHVPRNPEEGQAASGVLDRLAALGVYCAATQGGMAQAAPRVCRRLDVAPRAASLPFSLSGDQCAAVEDCLADIAGGLTMRRLINGDVGTGKTAVFGLVAAAMIDAGGRVAVMLPSDPLAKQVYRVLLDWWPDLAEGAVLVTADTPEQSLMAKRLLVGTTAVLFREVGELDLVVVDEQQKYSRDQREQLLSPGTHMLEASATCICRSQAMVRYGLVKVSQLRERHVARTVETRIWGRDEKRALFDAVLESLGRGEQVLVIHPVRATTKKDGLPSAEAAFEAWNRRFPGKVRIAHAGRERAENEAAIGDVRTGRASILVCTQIVEIGLDLPDVRRVLVMHPDRFGLTVLHQMRGRAARTGGVGYFDMLVERDISDESRARLDVLVRCADGFEVSQEDLRLRGFGDLGRDSEKQTGSDETFLFGRAVSVEALDEVAEAAGAARHR